MVVDDPNFEYPHWSRNMLLSSVLLSKNMVAERTDNWLAAVLGPGESFVSWTDWD